MKSASFITLICALGLLLPSAAIADERAALEALRETTLNLMKLLVEQGVLTQDKVDALLREAEQRAVAAPAAATAEGAAPAEDENTVRVPYVPEVVRNKIRDQIKRDVIAQARRERWGAPDALPAWLDRISWDGDFRLRWQQDTFQEDNAPVTIYPVNDAGEPTINLPSTTQNRERLRVRARLGMTARVSDGLTAGFRLSTGNTNDPVSTNQTLGNNANKLSLVLDRAWLRGEWYGWLSASGGRMPNPWFGSDLLWDEDLNFDGIAVTLKPQLTDTLTAFMTVGAFPLQESAFFSSEKRLYGGQLGLDWKTAGYQLKLGAAVYDFHKVEGTPEAVGSFGAPGYGYSSPQVRQRGNSLINIADPSQFGSVVFGLASQFREINFTGLLDVALTEQVHAMLAADYVRNSGFDQDEIISRTNVTFEPETDGYQARLTVGRPQMAQRHDWQVFGGYRYLERDAVYDAFTDSDFHLGGTDAKGYFLGANYGLAKNTWLSLRWLTSDTISGPPLAIDSFFTDLNARF